MRLDHPIFHTPFEVQVPLHEVDVPEHYAHYSLKPLPEKLPAWQVFERPAPPPGTEREPTLDLVGLVSDGFGFEDSPDCEWISSGLNSKGPDSLAIGRQANYFLWGFAADPSLFTPSAKDVFVNAVVYMKPFDGQRPLVRAVASPREWVGVMLWAAEQAGKDPAYRDPGQSPEQAVVEALRRYFGAATAVRFVGDPARVRSWYLDHLEQITAEASPDGHGPLVVDEDLVELGVSNRKLEFFDAVEKRWKANPDDELCPRVLARYVPGQAFGSLADLTRWVEANRDALFFSDAGGYSWRVAGQASPTPASGAPDGVGGHADGEHVRMRAVLALPRSEGELATLSLEFQFEEGWHGYAASSEGGFPLRPSLAKVVGLAQEGPMTAPEASSVHATAEGEQAWLTGRVTYVQKLKVLDVPVSTSVHVVARVVVCDQQRCLPPQELELTLEMPRR